ncbi:DUF262 domain-containing protein (plasmid) [Azospirillum argentinense]|uniref:DUF262 domain-containing protein n=1 Tax=Azospirillum argentinense TaxID=2970906 RepID=A0A4D8PP78_9PROT|nr:DUF262 domain-containing protein [Azospirillum argentinense]
MARDAIESLDRRPEARAYKVEDLLGELRRGRMRIPSFQRGIRWERDDAAKLLDSLWRGYPIGTLLFWETGAEAGEVTFGTVRVGGGKRSDALWVVDGQQRLMSLARVLLAPEPDRDEFALYFDLDEAEFVPPPTDRAMDPSRYLPMTEVLEPERLMQWVFRYAADQPGRRERAFTVGTRIRDYEIPAYLVRTEREQTLREIFGRTNSSGHPLKQSQVFDALNGARGQGRPASLRQIVSELASMGFGSVEETLLYRLLRVLQGRDVIEGKGEGPLRLGNADAERAYRETAEAARRVIQFLKDDVGIPRYDLLPYKQPFVLLGKFFHLHPDPGARSRQLLERWVWRGALTGAHRGDTVSTRATLERIVKGSEEDSVQRLLELVKDSLAALPDVDEAFNFRFATSKLLALAMLDLKPRDLDNGGLIEIDQDTVAEEGSFSMPPIIVKHDANNALRSTANRLIHPHRPKLRQRLALVRDPEILTSHGISPNAAQAIRDGDVRGFLRLRADFLRQHSELFFARHARWDENDRPSIKALLVEDEGA